MKFPWETDRLSRSEFEYRPRKQRVSEGLGDKMLTRVFSPTCWSQAERDEVTRCNLRQPSLTPTRGSKEPTRSPWTLLSFALLCFALHERPRGACSKDLSFTHGRMRLDKRAKCHEATTERVGVGNLRAICAYRWGICPRERERERERARERTSKGHRNKKCVWMLRQNISDCYINIFRTYLFRIKLYMWRAIHLTWLPIIL